MKSSTWTKSKMPPPLQKPLVEQLTPCKQFSICECFKMKTIVLQFAMSR
jgi:hypothetical protein